MSKCQKSRFFHFFNIHFRLRKASFFAVLFFGFWIFSPIRFIWGLKKQFLQGSHFSAKTFK